MTARSSRSGHDIAKGEALWQAEFERVRAAAPTPWARWISPRLVFVPSWVAHFYGGVCIWLGWILVGRDMLNVPNYIRRFILARQWGRVVHGHPLAGVGIFLCTGAMTLLIQFAGSALLSFAIGIGALVLMLWANATHRDLDADDSASRQVGRTGVQAGILWSVAEELDTLSPATLRRLHRMGWRPPRTCPHDDRRKRSGQPATASDDASVHPPA